jgi:uncharacterized protein YggT (Ycf19 family)
MGTEAGFAVLLSVISQVRTFVFVFVFVYSLIIFLYVIASFLPLPYTPILNRVQRFLHDASEPYLRLFRRFIPPLGPLDLSPLVAVIVLVIAGTAVDSLLARLG